MDFTEFLLLALKEWEKKQKESEQEAAWQESDLANDQNEREDEADEAEHQQG